MSTVEMNQTTDRAYPATLNIDYPDRPLNRLTSFFRILLVIPIVIILSLLSGDISSWGDNTQGWSMNTGMSISGTLFMALVLMILFRKKYPRWWFDWNLALTRFSYRIMTYFFPAQG